MNQRQRSDAAIGVWSGIFTLLGFIAGVAVGSGHLPAWSAWLMVLGAALIVLGGVIGTIRLVRHP